MTNRAAVGLPVVKGDAPLRRGPVRRRDITDDVADTRRRTAAFDGRCYLCGQPIEAAIFCHAHDWAAGGRR
jgi:hypothetical protein